MLTVELANRIFAREFKGGERLKESAVAAARGISRHTVRQALLRLEAEWLLTSRNDAGWSLPALGAEDLRDLQLARFAIESTALTRAAQLQRPFQRETVDAIKKVADSRADEPAGELRAREFTLRTRLVRECGSRRLLRMHRTVLNELRLWHVQHPANPISAFSTWHHDQLDLAGAIRAGQPGIVAGILARERDRP